MRSLFREILYLIMMRLINKRIKRRLNEYENAFILFKIMTLAIYDEEILLSILVRNLI